MPEFEREFKEYVEAQIHRATDNAATMRAKFNMKGPRFEEVLKEFETTFGSVPEAYRYYRLERARKQYFQKVHQQLWGETYAPEVGWME